MTYWVIGMKKIRRVARTTRCSMLAALRSIGRPCVDMLARAQVDLFCAKGKRFGHRVIARAAEVLFIVHHIGFLELQFLQRGRVVPLVEDDAPVLPFKIVAHPLEEGRIAGGFGSDMD